MGRKLQEELIKLIDHVLVSSRDYGFDKTKRRRWSWKFERKTINYDYTASSTKFIKVENQ